MLSNILKKVFGTQHERDMRKYWPVVAQINALESKYEKLSNDELARQTILFKERIAKGESLDQILPEAFAVAREGGKRALGMRHYDVQLIGGMVLHQGAIAEMKTGEGKTLVATLAVYLNALAGRGVHLVTVNDYLARRDAEWMSKLYGFLGLTTGVITHELSDRQRQENYNCDITYATNNELGFDYLRDNMKFRLSDYVQRELNFAIVDECDSILIDEARTPLIISGQAERSTEKYVEVNKIIPKLQLDVHFTMEEKSRTVALTDEGNARVEELLNIENLYDPVNIELVHHIYQALKAHHLYKKDVDYMVKNGEVVIVDEFTGRLMEGRRWSDGLHQAVEAKEGVPIKNENQTLASITFQNYFRMYNKLSGMTGTADTEALEFKKIYNLDVIVIPTNKPMIRKDREDIIYKTDQAKYKAIIDDILERQAKGQPILVGTASIEKSELISRELNKRGIPHNVLNAKHHEMEAEIVAQAGAKGHVTIATNMAGRGTDIVLGGNPHFRAVKETGQTEGPEYEAALKKHQELCQAEREEVLKAGGLYIIGTERHESRRIDNQLRGRAGRQGDPGESRFYLSLEDDLMRKFQGDRLKRIMETLKIDDDEPIISRMVSRSIESAQRKVEGHNFDIRKNLLEYDDVMNKQRQAIYGLRRQILENQNLDELVLEMLADVTTDILDQYAPAEAKRSTWDLEGLRTAIEKQFGITLSASDLHVGTAEELTDKVRDAVKARYDAQKAHMGPLFGEVEKSLLLGALDHWWKEHLQRVDKVREWVNLKAYAQKDPLLEYKKEAFIAFEEMQRTARADVIEKLMKIQIVLNREPTEPGERSQEEEEALEALRPKENPKMILSAGGPAPQRQGRPNMANIPRAQRRKMQRQKIKK
jgi:preprotein translocase subunit SecA